MKYMILHYFFIVHLCNIKISAVSTSHKTKGKHYDIDGFISQLLASRKFDDLAEKLAEKAVNKIMLIDAAPAHIQRAFDNNTESTQEVNQNQLNREYVKKCEKNQLNNVKRKDFTEKINPQAVINATSSLTENLQLKYKYLKKNALEKKVRSNRDLLSKNDSKEDSSKHNKTTGPADFKDHNNKTEKPIFNQNATEKNQNETKNESVDENKYCREDRKDDDRKEDHTINSELNESCHSATDGETKDSSKKPDHSLEGLSPGNELTIFHEAQNSGHEAMGIVEQEESQVNNALREDKPSNLNKDNQKPLTPSEEKIIEEVEKSEREAEKRGTEEIKEDENVIAQFRTREDSIEKNKVTSDLYPYVSVYRTRTSDDSGDDKSKQQSPEDQKSKELSSEAQRSTEQSTEDQSSKEQSGEDPNSSKLKAVIRKDGDKLYTYVRAPEYEDYHEKLAKWRKHHPENPADFMK